MSLKRTNHISKGTENHRNAIKSIHQHIILRSYGRDGLLNTPDTNPGFHIRCCTMPFNTYSKTAKMTHTHHKPTHIYKDTVFISLENMNG